MFEDDRRRTANLLRQWGQGREDIIREVIVVLGLPEDFPPEQLAQVVEQRCGDGHRRAA